MIILVCVKYFSRDVNRKIPLLGAVIPNVLPVCEIKQLSFGAYTKLSSQIYRKSSNDFCTSNFSKLKFDEFAVSDSELIVCIRTNRIEGFVRNKILT